MKQFRPPVADALLEKYNFFELYPFDGGGYFIQKEIVGSLNDREITRRILQGALADFGSLDELDFIKFERWSTIEKSCWINRMYFIVSLARCAMLDKDAALAGRIAAIISRFNRMYRPPFGREEVQALQREVTLRRDRDYNSGNAMGEVSYQWYDFQPASRIINVINAMHFLRDFTLPQEEFIRFIRNNAQVIMDADDEHSLKPGNHQALRGLALLYAGNFLDEPEYIRAGNIVCNYHMTQDYLPDGMLIDMSPSYHVFEAWIGRDALALGTISKEAQEMLEKAFRICREFRQPDGSSIVLNDGYSLDMRGFLESAGKSASPEESFVLPHSGMAFFHSPEVFAALDATPCRGKYSHYHGGKNGVTLWFAGQPFLVDSGCCSYDDEDFWNWYKLPEAHSTLLVNGKGDSELRGRYDWIKAREYRMDGAWKDNSIECASDSWQRRLSVPASNEVLISDDVQLPEPASLEFLFILHPAVAVSFKEERIVLGNDQTQVLLRWEADAPVSWKLSPGKCFIADRSVPGLRLHLCANVASFSMRTFWNLENKPE
ncbi:MAG: hypothetical protein GX946_08565 [Oligosphaeraceae bacterium]|nr:hypothetical protein [Oligosphaeraceae bacterium]